MKKIPKKILLYGEDILKSERMITEKDFIQHGSISCYDHSLNVAKKSLIIAGFLLIFIKINEKSLIRGALLHDYFLYDWHKSGSAAWIFSCQMCAKKCRIGF